MICAFCTSGPSESARADDRYQSITSLFVLTEVQLTDAVTSVSCADRSGERLYIKVADLLPKFTFLGPSLDEALNLQRQHEELLRQIQNLPTPLEEFYHKVQEKIAANERPDPVLIEEMATSLGAVWQDIKKMLQERRDIILLRNATAK
ncbi:hypothetical protein RP20_CCG018835 [Aedes albopictus]|nr:hypothetical protein RP20_CCG018835 [Aedes albopictus]